MSEDIQKQIRSLRNEDQSGRTTYDYRKQCNRAADSLESLSAEVSRLNGMLNEALTYNSMRQPFSDAFIDEVKNPVSGSPKRCNELTDDRSYREHWMDCDICQKRDPMAPADNWPESDDSSPTPCEWCNGTGKRDCGDPSNGLIDCTHCSTADDSREK